MRLTENDDNGLRGDLTLADMLQMEGAHWEEDDLWVSAENI